MSLRDWKITRLLFAIMACTGMCCAPHEGIAALVFVVGFVFLGLMDDKIDEMADK